MNMFAKSMLSLALGLGLSTSAFAQSASAPHADKAPAKADVSKAAPASNDKAHNNAKVPAKKSLQSKATESSAVKPAEVKKNEPGTVHNTAKDLSKSETPAKSVK